MLYSLAIVLALAMVLCMIPAAFADLNETVTDKSYNLKVYAVDKNGVAVSSPLNTETNANSITAKYNYEKMDAVVTGKFTEDKKMAIVEVNGFNTASKTLTDVEVTIDGKDLEVNELASAYKGSVGWMNGNQVNFPVELTKAGYTDTYLIEVTGKYQQGTETVNYKETAKISVKLENTAEYKNAKTATISKITTDNKRLDAYIVGSKLYLDFVADTVSGPSKEEIEITYKDEDGDLFNVVTWAYSNDEFAVVDEDGAAQKDGVKLDDSMASYKVNNCATVDGEKVIFELETASAKYETKEYTVVVRTGILESDPKGIVFAEPSKTIAIGEEYTPVVYGVETGKKVDATISQGKDYAGHINNVIDVDSDTVIGTQEGVAYITASYTTNDGKTYTASSMKITVTAKGATDDDDTTDGKTYMVTASSLRVRSGAGTNFSQIGSLKNGATVKVESIANGWAKLENGGYVSAQYLAEVVDNGEAQTMYVTARTLNVRKGPGTSYAKVGTLSRGTAVQVVGFSGNWAKLSNGYYVSTSYLSK